MYGIGSPGNINILLRIIDRLLNSRQVRREATFEEIISPLHENLINIHLDYREILMRFKRSIPSREGKSWRCECLEKDSLTKKQAEEIVKESIERYKEDRKTQEHVRDVLRKNAQSYLQAVQSNEEKRYIYSLIIYFQENDHRPGLENKDIDEHIERIMENGGNSEMDTPTTVLYQRIEGTLDGDKVRNEIEKAIYELDHRILDAMHAYAKLQMSIIKRRL